MSQPSSVSEVCKQAGAVFSEEAGWLTPRNFGSVEKEYWSACRETALFDMSHRGKIEVTGPDARTFLHNLCTNDIVHLEPDRGCEAFFATLKAKVVAYVFIYRSARAGRDDILAIDGDPAAAGKLFAHLNRYLISEQVELTDRTQDYAAMHLVGPGAGAVLDRVAGPGPAAPVEFEERRRSLSGSEDCRDTIAG